MLNKIKKFGNLFFLFIIFIYLSINNNFQTLYQININILFVCFFLSLIIIIINTYANILFVNLFRKCQFLDIFKITSINSISNFILIGSGVVTNSLILKTKYDIEIKKFAIFSFHKSLISFIVFTPPALLISFKLNMLVFFLLLIIQMLVVYIFFSRSINFFFNKILGKKLISIIIEFQNYRLKLFKLNHKLFIIYFFNYIISSLIFLFLFKSFNLDMTILNCFLFVSLINISKFFFITFLDIGIGEIMIGLLFMNDINLFSVVILVIIAQKFIYFCSSLLCYLFLIIYRRKYA